MGQPLINLEEGWRAIRDWRFTFDLTIDLLVAVGLAALIAYHPKRPKRLTNLEQLDQIHTLLMYPVVGVIVATVVQTVPEMAYAVFGIGGLLRFRTDVGPVRNTGKAILVTVVGLACGLDLFALAFLGTGFTWLLLYFLESRVFYRLVIHWVGSDKHLHEATDAYRNIVISEGFELIGENKNFSKLQASFIFRTPAKLTTEEVQSLFARIPEELRGSLDWERA
jgi:hypothetical protein